MPRQHKIKRSRPKTSYRARPHPLTVLLGVVVLGALVFVGISIYQPVMDFFENRSGREVSLPELPDPELAPDGPDGEGGGGWPELPDLNLPTQPDQVDGLRAVWASNSLVRDSAAFAAFLDGLSGSEINAVMVDIKDQNGQILFNSRNESAAAWNTLSETPFDLDAVAAALQQRDLHLIVRMSAFKDEPASRADKDNAIHYQNLEETLWLDNYADQGGKPWLSPYAPGTRAYLSDLAGEAVDRGAVMVVMTDFQFPDGSIDANVGFMGLDAGVSRGQALAEFAAELADTLAERGARLALYYPAATFVQTDANLYRFGGEPQAVFGEGVELQLGLLPYQFGADYSVEGLEIARPLESMAATARTALSYVQSRISAEVPIVALLQGGPESSVSGQTVTAETVREQMQAAGDLGVREYVLYCTDSAAYFTQ